jgi:hypothetical protein
MILCTWIQYLDGAAMDGGFHTVLSNSASPWVFEQSCYFQTRVMS